MSRVGESMRDSTRTRVASSGAASLVNSETLNRRAVVEMVAPLAPVERAMRITGSLAGFVSLGSLDLLTTELESIGHVRGDFSDLVSDDGSCCCACANSVNASDEQTTAVVRKKIAVLLIKFISKNYCYEREAGRAGRTNLTTIYLKCAAENFKARIMCKVCRDKSEQLSSVTSLGALARWR